MATLQKDVCRKVKMQTLQYYG